MGHSAKIAQTVTVGGQNYTETLNVLGDNAIHAAPAGGIPAAKAGTLTTRTDNDTGDITLGAGHGIVSTDVVDVYWSGGKRLGMVATVAGDVASVDGGAGDVLPAAATAVKVMKPVTEPFVVTGNNVKALVAKSTNIGVIRFISGVGIEYEVALAANGTDVWIDGSGVANPIAGDAITSVSFSHGELAAVVMEAIALYN